MIVINITLNIPEKAQYRTLIEAIRADAPANPRPARDHVPLVRGRVCVFLNQQISSHAQDIRDIKVLRNGTVNLYFHD